jgi:hypothetical protein
MPWLVLFLCLVSCSNLEKSESREVRKRNYIKEPISRHKSDHLLRVVEPKQVNRELYPFEDVYQGPFQKITKEFFCCKGSFVNPSFMMGKERLFDCAGKDRHSLPLKNEQEFVYPILMDLLNYVQVQLQRQVEVTCGHRCPQHNRYSDPSEGNRTSKHMIGAEVDFYVKGLEQDPMKVIHCIMSYYESTPYATFLRYQKSDTNVKTPPWYNHEIFVKLYQKNEGRDFDNSHPYPYISIQVRHDLDQNQRVSYTWEQAFYSYLRY